MFEKRAVLQSVWVHDADVLGGAIHEIDPPALGEKMFNHLYPVHFETEAEAVAAAPKLQADWEAKEKIRLAEKFDEVMAAQEKLLMKREIVGFKHPTHVLQRKHEGIGIKK